MGEIETGKYPEEIDKCPECNGSHIVEDEKRGETYCGKCGLVLYENMTDNRAERPVYSPEQMLERTRTGLPPTNLIHDKGLSTTIGKKNKDYSCKSIPSRNRSQMYRIRKYQTRLSAKEQRLACAITEIDRLCSSFGLNRNVKESVALIYRKVIDKGLLRGRDSKDVIAALIYAACRENKTPRTLEEIATYANRRKKDVGRRYRVMSKILKLNLEPTKPQDYVQRVCSELSLDIDITSRANEIVKEYENLGKGSYNPVGVAGAAIYIACELCGQKRTQKDIAKVAGVSEPTIRSRYQGLCKKLNIDI